ncbi:hypothetical protein WICPIJ_000675 [Wickerhamomyces pijperi]|uniref:Thiamine pyrophosphokinase n=1 Tax=Wickerhamomyces pijperi TaxID=599730 RepID=A0A9P8QC53_WICPI|nr:hypothetical protein WICPIJ_000675 [Wickerhamomyces pijperi]
MTQVTENPETLHVPAFNPQQDAVNLHELNLPEIFNPSKTNINHTALLILNQKIDIPNFSKLWSRYDLKVCADGGANRLYDYSKSNRYIPDFIIGDLDSLRDEVKSYYASQGVTIIKQSTQYDSDLGKCLKFIECYYHNLEQQTSISYGKINDYDGISILYGQLQQVKCTTQTQVLIIGGINGRFDHTIQSINTMIRHYHNTESNHVTDKANFQNLSMYYLTNVDLIAYLPPGHTQIILSDSDSSTVSFPYHGSNCGLLPLTSTSVKLTTMGLKWDVVDWVSEMGENVSSSNRVVGKDRIIIKCEGSRGVIFSLELDYEKVL